MKPSAKSARNLLLVIIALIGLRLIFGLQPIEDGLNRAIAPFSQAIEGIAYSGDYQSNQQSGDEAQISQLMDLNERYKKQLGLPTDQISAEVIRKDIVGFRKQLVINKGSSSGIKQNQAVLSGGYLVGVISRTTKSTATVKLINDPDFRVTASTSSGEGGVVKTENGSLIFDLVPGENLENQAVLTDGVDTQFRPELLIGTLGRRITSKENAFHKYHLVLSNSLAATDFVTVDSGVN